MRSSGLAERDGDAVLPGTTHIQPAQPVLFAHHLLAYVEMAERDRARLADARRRVNISPLGAGALAGAGYPLDRETTARELGFEGVTANSLDAVSDRDFVVEVLAAVALGMVHLSRLAEEITWWSNPRFGFVRASDAFSTGSSIMPNKKNPDPAELVRGRSARVIGALTGTLAMLKGLPLAYQRDLQEDKAPLFDAVAVYEASLGILAGMLETLSIDAERMRAAAGEGYTTATAVADTLVRRGMPFRVAHHVVGALVARAEGEGIELDALDDAAIAAALHASGDADAAALAVTRGSATRCAPRPRSTVRSRRATSSVGRRRHGCERPSPPSGAPRRRGRRPGPMSDAVRALSRAELAAEADVPEDLVDRLVDLGQLRPLPDGRFDSRDEAVLATVRGLEGAGIGGEDVAWLVGHLGAGLGSVARMFSTPAPRDAPTYRELIASLGDLGDRVPSIYAAFGLSEPEPDRPMRSDEASVITRYVRIWATVDPDGDTDRRVGRLAGESSRRVMEAGSTRGTRSPGPSSRPRAPRAGPAPRRTRPTRTRTRPSGARRSSAISTRGSRSATSSRS